MLSIHRKLSPIRIGAGLAGITTVSLAALALTASGSQAAERIRDKVSGAIQAQDVPVAPVAPAAPAAPAAPGAPAAPPAPPAPPAPAAPAVPEGPTGKHRVVRIDRSATGGHAIKKMVIVRQDGKQQEITMPDMVAIQASIPEIRNGSCGKGNASTVEHRDEGGKQVMIICSDRIAAMSASAAQMAMHGKAMAMNTKQMAMNSALMSLQHARRTIEVQSSLSPRQRAEALKGIDEALAELRDDAKDDSDD